MKSLALLLAIAATAFGAPPPPGEVIHHSLSSSGHYIGSPSICILPNGDYLASHDISGPSRDEHGLCRTAWDDDEGGAHNYHDANSLTFHRWKNFRTLTRKEDVQLPDLSPAPAPDSE